ncbi:MAG: DNA repair protein RadC [Kiloniellales bacterium]
MGKREESRVISVQAQAPKQDAKAKSGGGEHAGHRQRLRERLLEHGSANLADYEVLEMLLFGAQARGDTKPMAKRLLKAFGSVSAILAASREDLLKVEGVGTTSVALLKVTYEAGRRLAREELYERPVVNSHDKVVAYCRTEIGHGKVEQLLLLFLDNKYNVIADERHQRGTVNHTPAYPREIVKRALDHGASFLILVHNHPSGDTRPSRADIKMTEDIGAAAKPMGIAVVDHIIISKREHFSFKSNGLL